MLEIKNPEKQNIMLSLIVAVLGAVIIFIPFVIKAVSIYQFYFTYAGVVVIVFSLGYAIYYYRRYREFEAFMEKKDEALIWEYDEAQYVGFIGELNEIQKNSEKKKIWILLGIELVISILLFIMLSEGMKWLGFVFFAFFATLSVLFTLILPQSFKYKALVKPYVTIIQEDGAYIMGRFHRWSKAQAKLKNYDNGEKMYKVLAINYEALTRNGRLFQEWTAVIPNPDDSSMIAEAKTWVSRINKFTRLQEKKMGERKSRSEQLFEKLVGKNKKLDKATESKTQK
ncbi:MAG: hypothetical protein PWP56_696 [Acetobacterium sp.]|jgi:hypothetical protein|uniref:hypothetical protein n=1 Tax=Acetobacterium sp. K1/6 TaxID=3055467 RepID=UPI0029E1FE3F|nr:hypothetical protein [Acetobacterium sp. K1/6]MDK2941183.1 hypothetical protein [Acetobacterium sp.]MDZ5726057.1 hypothetical protein [Acetobacterium sp. K1/6]